MLVPRFAEALTPEQLAELRLWHGRVHLLDRVKAMRRYTLATIGAIGLGIAGFVVGVNEAPPLVLAPIVPAYMWMKMWRRGKSLRESGLRLRRVFLSLRARRAIPAPSTGPSEQELLKLAPREVLAGPHGPAIRRAAEERVAILQIVATLPKADRALLPDVVPTVNGLVERVAHLAQAIQRLEQSVDPGQLDELDARIAEAERDPESSDGERRLTLLRRQRATMDELAQRRAALGRQIESAGLALGNLRLDLIKLRSSGLQSALSDVSTATQEARALSREIGTVLSAVAEVREL